MSSHTITSSALIVDEIPHFSRQQRRRSIGICLHIVIESIIEAYATYASYNRQIEQGVAAGIAIRKAFKLKNEDLDPINLSSAVATMHAEHEQIHDIETTSCRHSIPRGQIVEARDEHGEFQRGA